MYETSSGCHLLEARHVIAASATQFEQKSYADEGQIDIWPGTLSNLFFQTLPIFPCISGSHAGKTGSCNHSSSFPSRRRELFGPAKFKQFVKSELPTRVVSSMSFSRGRLICHPQHSSNFKRSRPPNESLRKSGPQRKGKSTTCAPNRMPRSSYASP